MTVDPSRSHRLENDPRNSCIGCGPNNPRGLRLEFRGDGKRIATDLIADETLEGWPERLHSGVLYLAMLDVANWTVYGLHDRVGLPVQTSALTLQRWVPTGTRLSVGRGRAIPDRGPHDPGGGARRRGARGASGPFLRPREPSRVRTTSRVQDVAQGPSRGRARLGIADGSH